MNSNDVHGGTPHVGGCAALHHIPQCVKTFVQLLRDELCSVLLSRSTRDCQRAMSGKLLLYIPDF